MTAVISSSNSSIPLFLMGNDSYNKNKNNSQNADHEQHHCSFNDSLNFDDSSDHIKEMVVMRHPARRFTMPKKLGSDRLLLVSKALHEIPTYKSISPTLQRQRKSLKPPLEEESSHRKRVHFRAVDQVVEYEKEYSREHHADLWFTDAEFASIFEREDQDYTFCFGDMAHTKHILQLWGMCSRDATSPRNATTVDNNDTTSATASSSVLPQAMATAVDTLFRNAPHERARGLENRIVTGIRNHRQKAVQSFLQHYRDTAAAAAATTSADGTTAETATTTEPSICPRYLKFSQTAACFARALAEGDARVVQQQSLEEGALDGHEEEEGIDFH